MNLTIQKHDKYCVVRTNEEYLDNLKSTQLKSELAILNSEGIKNMVLDLSDVVFIDSSGLGAVLVGNRLCKDAKGTFVVACARQQVLQLIKISQLQQVLTLIPTVKEAVDFVLIEELERDIRG